MPTRTPGNGRHVVVGWAFTLLVVAVVLHVVAGLLRDIAPELIGIGIVAAIVYVAYLVHRFRRSRW